MRLPLTPTSTTDIKRPPRLWRIAALCGATLVVVTFTIGLWQRGERHGAGTARAISASTLASGGSRSSVPTAAGRAPAPPIMYVVDSQEDAAFLRRFSAELNRWRALRGQPPVDIIVVAANGMDSLVLEALPRPPDTSVIDLRAR